jgi:hypothetical protein
MNLRDWFAGMALQGMLASVATNNTMKPAVFGKPEEVAETAYKFADAMIIEQLSSQR